jgi:hypothetical protein
MGLPCGESVVGGATGVTHHTTMVNTNSKPQHQVMTRAEVGSTTCLSMLNQGSCSFYTLPHTSASKVTARCTRLPTAFGSWALGVRQEDERLAALVQGDRNLSLSIAGLKRGRGDANRP